MVTTARQNPRLQAAFVKIVANGLRAATTSDCAKWATSYRTMGAPFPGKFTFDHHPWLRKMHQTRAPKCVGKKAAQLGYSETMLNVTFYTLDQLKRDVLYVLPNSKPDAADFSATRFDTALESSEYITNMFNNVKNVGLKRAGLQSLYIRGSRSRSSLKSLPVGTVILDEFEEFDEGALPLVVERMSGQLSKQLWLVSTPLIPNAGIDLEYNTSNQQHFMFHCPYCSKITELSFPECLVITADSFSDPKIKESHLICKECSHPLDYLTKQDWLRDGFWQALNPSSDVEGFYINQLYSMTVQPSELAVSALKSQMSQVDEQEFWNSKIGVAHIVANASISDEQLNNCIRDYLMDDPRYFNQTNVITTIGVDVGSTIHYCIMHYYIDHTILTTDINFSASARVYKVGTVKEFEALKPIIMHYQPAKIIVDDMPDTRAALTFIRQFPTGFGALCHYGTNATAREILDYGERVTCNRTAWLDTSLGRVINNRVSLPRNIPFEFKEHCKHLVKVYLKDKNGESTSQYKKCGEDHYAHAMNYAEIALRLASGQGITQDIKERIIG